MRVLRWALRIFAVLAALYLYIAALHPREHVPGHPFFDKPGPWAIAHRGGRGLWPENTLLAFERARQLGVDAIEMDLRATADGAIVVIHDRTVDRTTNGSGRVDQMTLAQIRALDAGYKFRDSSGQFPYRGQGLTVPLLEEVLAGFSDARLNVEMKEFTPDLAGKLCRLINQADASKRVLVASFDHDVMLAFRNACPAVATSATLREAVLFYQLARTGLISLYRGPAVALQVTETLRGRRIIDRRLLKTAREMNIHVEVWTVNDEAVMKRLLDLGVHGILTDYPDRLLRVMGRPVPQPVAPAAGRAASQTERLLSWNT
jgi:glycerophosphoryl diester phosphodiesterase